MTIAAKDVVRQAAHLLNDIASISWGVNRLVDYLNAGMTEVASLRPDLLIQQVDLTLADGVTQEIPSDGEKFVKASHNAGTSRRAVTPVSESDLDSCDFGWRGRSGATEVLHYIYDPRKPRQFDVYPPARAGAKLAIEYAAEVTPLAIPAYGQTHSVVTGNLPLPQSMFNPMVDYVVYRAHSEAREFAQPARAVAHRQLFEAAIGMQAKSTAAVATE
jgi:hypothetical protein